jgi:resuscitation-promoting factor RpfB
MQKRTGFMLSGGLVLLGLALLGLSFYRPITIMNDGQKQTVQAIALTSGQALRSAGIALAPGDRLAPPEGNWLGWNSTIRIEHVRPVSFWIPGGIQSQALQSAERIPANLALQAGIKLFPGDVLRWNGQSVSLQEALPAAEAFILQYQPAVPLTIQENGQSRVFYSAAATVGEAIWQAGIRLDPQDRLSLSEETALDKPETVALQRAIPITIKADGQQFPVKSAAASVGQALAENGLSLQGLDYSIPPDDQPLPDANGTIRVVRVQEQIILQETSTPFQTVTVTDASLDLDQSKVVLVGQTGLQVSRVRVRYEDGKEVSRQTDSQWTAKAPVDQKVAYGTKLSTHSLQIPGGTVQYWKTMTVYATSYSPCNSGGGRCYPGTSLGLPVKRGVIAVTSAWYRYLAGTQVYIPGYGKAVIADIGAGIPGTAWIDLGFADSDYETWHQNVTIYFLNPAPTNLPWNIP